MARPLRIAYVAYRGNMNSGGQGIYLWFLAREMARLGHEVSVFVGPPYPDPMPFATVHQLPNRQLWDKWILGKEEEIVSSDRPKDLFRPLNFYELAASRLGFLPEPFAFSLRAFGHIRDQLRNDEGYDLVHDVQCLGYGLLGIRALGLPVITTVHHPLTVDRRASLLRDETFQDVLGTMKFYPIAMQSFVARRLDCVLTSSEASAHQIVQDFGVRPEKIRNVRNGLDTQLFSPDPRIERNGSELLCVGRSADPNKGIRTLIHCLARLPEHIKLTLVDDDTPENQVHHWAREAGVEHKLRLTGRVEVAELVDLYRRATLVVVPSRYEGFGLPAVEAMACGTPVVATRAGALPEVIELTGGGLLSEPDDPDSLARTILIALGDSAGRARMAECGREKVVEKFSWPRIAAATAEVYAETVARFRRGRPTTTITSDSVGH
jgi:glycosyltransferase involved in cell wall biosynthesis